MERICHSCGKDPGQGAFCQHCGAQQADVTAPTSPPPAVVPPQPPAATPPQVIVPQVPAKRSGCLGGCSVVGVIALLVVAVGGFFGWRFISEEVLPGVQETADVFSASSEIPPGPCYDLEVEGGLLVDWTEVSCEGPRQIEVSFAADFEDGQFPGDELLATRAADTCREAFGGYVGVPPEDSIYGADWLVPTDQTWSEGSRQGICLVVADDGSDLSGTVKGSER